MTRAEAKAYIIQHCIPNYPKMDKTEWDVAMSMAIEALSREPCDNVISRQAAINALADYIHNVDKAMGAGRLAEEDCQNMAERELEGLPSIQPERTCVNCGRTANNGGWYADGRTRCPIEEHYALPKDGFCHLWEKRNVTDDDYPERMEE